MIKSISLVLIAGMSASVALAADTVVEMKRIDATGVGAPLGKITITASSDGVRLAPDLNGLPPGSHGFHLHENGSCLPGEKVGSVAAGIAAGHHYDPAATGKHEGPAGSGHLGDLPLLTVDDRGMATSAVTAPRLKIEALKGRSLMIHAGGDNYSDLPEKGGGGGARIACGVIP